MLFSYNRIIFLNFISLLKFYVSKSALSFTEGQPESIVEDIENMVRSYVEKVSH